MALIACKDCHKDYSTDARRCPHCGARKATAGGKFFDRKTIALYSSLALAVFLIGAYWFREMDERNAVEKIKVGLVATGQQGKFTDEEIKKMIDNPGWGSGR